MLVYGVEIPNWVIGTSGAVVLLYYLGTKNHDYFKKRGIPCPRPYPFIGNIHLFNKYDLYNMHSELKKIHGKLFGFFVGNAPEYIVFDEEMISQITVKQFQNFGDRRPQELGIPEFDLMLTAMNGDHWKAARAQMSPAFTTGKLRLMSSEINRAGKALADKLSQLKEPFEAKNLAGRFTMDVIASTAFGLRIDAHGSDNNDFIRHGTKMTSFSNSSMIVFFLFPSLVPYLNRLGVPLINMEAIGFFMAVVDQTFKGRVGTTDSKVHADFLQLMVQSQQQGSDEQGESKVQDHMSKDEILANALLFFFAGFETTSTGLSCLMHFLAVNQDIQDTLVKEIDEVLEDKEEVDYDSTLKMHYLDQCIQETLRIFPPGPFIDRICKVDTELCGVKIEKGAILTIPIMAIHNDPEIWPEPEKFDPERFSPENKVNISPFHWMPFGYGPRNCIGMRLALFEIKVAIATLLKNHRLGTCEKTQIPLQLSKSDFMKPDKGIWLTVEKRL